MRLYTMLIATACLALAGCGKAPDAGNATADAAKPARRPPLKSAEEVVLALKTAGLPIQDMTVHTAEDDPDKRLGRPGQYVSKTAFIDSRHPPGDRGGSKPVNIVEVFANHADAQSRHTYIEQVTQAATPFLMHHQILRGNVLVRLNKILTPSQAEEYRTALEKIVPEFQ